MSIEHIENNGLRVPLSAYRKLKAFQSGGFYWDHQPQQLVRQSLGEFLPQVEIWEDAEGSFGWFRRDQSGRERLCNSKPVGSRNIPPEELTKLAAALEMFTRAAQSEETQPHNRELIGQFRLPNPETDPELYRLSGPPWDRKLQILWGCEKAVDSSLPPGAALRTLKPDKFYFSKQLLWVLFGALWLLFLLWLLTLLASALSRGYQRVVNDRPIAHVAVANTDVPGRKVLLNLGSTDPDGKIAGHKIDWGDGTSDFVPAGQNHPEKKYPKDGDYTVKVTALDNLGAHSNPVETPLKFDHEAKLQAAEAAKQAAKKLEDDAKKQAADAQRQQEFEAKKLAAEEQARKEAEDEVIKRSAENAKQQAQKETSERLEKEAAAAAAEKSREQAVADEQAKEHAKKSANSSQASSSNKQAENPATPGEKNGASSGFHDVTTGRNVKVLKFQKPKYPYRARVAEISGMVAVTFTVDSKGAPKDIKITSEENGEYFKDAVLEELHKARFQPATVDGEAIEQRVSYQVDFRMEK